MLIPSLSRAVWVLLLLLLRRGFLTGSAGGDSACLVRHLRDNIRIHPQGYIVCAAHVAVAMVSVGVERHTAALHGEELAICPDGDEVQFGEDDGEVACLELGWSSADEAVESCEGELKTYGCVDGAIDVEEGGGEGGINGAGLLARPAEEMGCFGDGGAEFDEGVGGYGEGVVGKCFRGGDEEAGFMGVPCSGGGDDGFRD